MLFYPMIAQSWSNDYITPAQEQHYINLNCFIYLILPCYRSVLYLAMVDINALHFHKVS